MSVEIAFRLNTSLSVFVDWLHAETKSIDGTKFLAYQGDPVDEKIVEELTSKIPSGAEFGFLLESGYYFIELQQAMKWEYETWIRRGELAREQLRGLAAYKVPIKGCVSFSSSSKTPPSISRETMILFDIVVVADEQISVIAKCLETVVVDYFGYLLWTIMQHWPETKEQLLQADALEVLMSTFTDTERRNWELLTRETSLPQASEERRGFEGEFEHLEQQESASDAMKDLTVPSRDLAGGIVPAKLDAGGKYGTCRDISEADVKKIVKRCREFKARGGSVPIFYDQLNIVSGEPRSFELETLRSWLKNPKFDP